MDTTRGFHEIPVPSGVVAQWKASPSVAARTAQLLAFATDQNLSFDAEGLTRMNEFWIALDRAQGPVPGVDEFMPHRKGQAA